MLQRGKELEFKSVFKKSRISGISTTLEWVCLGALLFVAYVIFMYADITDTYDNSILFLKAISSGNLLRFYSYSVEHARMAWAANYEFVIYVVYGLWNLPVLIASKLLGIDYLEWRLGLLWCKTLGILFTFGTAWIMYKILCLRQIPRKYAVLGPFLFLSSLALYLIVFVISQVDGFALFLLVLGLYYYLQEKDGRFLLCFMVAMPTKMFALFLYIPLVLLREKRIPWILGSIAVVFSLNIVSKLLFGGDPAYGFALGSQSRDAILQIMDSSVFLGQVYIPFVLFYLGLCVCCYLYDGYRKDRSRLEIPIYCSAAVWILFVSFINFNSYWALYLMPFLILAILSSGRFLKVCCLLELLFSVGYLGVVLSICLPLLDLELSRRLLLPNLFPIAEYEMTRYGSLKYMFEMMGGTAYASFFSTCMGGALLCLLVLTCPFLFRRVKAFEHLERTVLWVRLASLAGFLTILLYACVGKAPDVLYTTFPQEKMVSEVNLLSGNVMEQEIMIQKDGEIHEMQFYFENPDYIRNNFCSVRFELVALDSGKVMAGEVVGCSMIPSGEMLTVKLDKTQVKAGEKYLVRLTGVPGIQVDSRVGRSLYPYVTAETEGETPLSVNGVPQETSLYLRLR